ncbi:signal peptidase I protein [Besnoitia besnoiti]|uniref:Signal peptidase I protein n=1 Tax=Besnoitia besnoiti TaxID=94643 RepID=A0A2A9MC61_BESBE|nr:signal peptidase I protein [Besnoitia besnoiti]PFH35565.1 signal peptidase I protein [Besnoitia besnoiti]
MWQHIFRQMKLSWRPALRAKRAEGGQLRSRFSQLMDDSYSVFYVVSRCTVAVSLCSLCQAYLFWVEQARGLSMEPTIPGDGGLLVVEKLRRRLSESSLFRNFVQYQRGSIVLLIPPDADGVVCKRIIGLPGDVLEVERGDRGFIGCEPVLVPRGHVWVQGDNGKASLDSRTYGCVSQGAILGTAMFSLWPPRLLPNTPPSMNGTRIISTCDALPKVAQ